MIDVVEILEHWYSQRTKSEVARSLGVNRETVRKYVRPAEEAGFVPGEAVVTTATWVTLARQWFPELMVPELASAGFASCNVHHELIKTGLLTSTLSTVHQRLRDEGKLAISENTLRRYAAVALAEQVKANQVTVLKDDPPAGEEAQVDYGKLGMWFDPQTMKRRTLWAFVMVLAMSRHMFVRPTLLMTQSEWVAAHVAAAEFFGGLPRRLVVDNLKTGVDRPDLYDPKINHAYAEFAHHYGVLIDPARAGKPKDKPRVERPMPYIRDSFYSGRDYPDLESWRSAAVDWCTDVAGTRKCRPIDGASPAALFEAVEAGTLLALPVRPFELATWSAGMVHPDCHLKVGKTLYSVPWRLIGCELQARSTDRIVSLYLRGELVKTHIFKAKGRQTDFGDYPPDKVAFLQRTPAWCRARAEDIGPCCTQVVAELMSVNALYRLRSAQAVIGLAERHTAERTEVACGLAIEVGDPSYRTIKGILAAGREAANLAEPVGLQTPAFLRGPDGVCGEVAS